MINRRGTLRATVQIRPGDGGERTTHELDDGAISAFGRNAACAVRFGHLPLEDRSIPGRVGVFVVANRRVCVQADRSAADLARPLRLRTTAGETALLPGWGMSPPDSHFTIVVAGEQDWELDVTCRPSPAVPPRRAAAGAPTIDLRPALDAGLWQTLEAYAQPVLAGRRVPATDDEVAASTSHSRDEARRQLEAIHDEFTLRQMWMPDVADTRIRVVEAAICHQLLPRER